MSLYSTTTFIAVKIVVRNLSIPKVSYEQRIRQKIEIMRKLGYIEKIQQNKCPVCGKEYKAKRYLWIHLTNNECLSVIEDELERAMRKNI